MVERKHNKTSVVFIVSSALLLSACGGSGDSTEGSPSAAEEPEASQSDVSTAQNNVPAADGSEDPVDAATDKVANVTEPAMDDQAEVEQAVADASDEMEPTAVVQSGDGASEYASLTGDAAKGRRVFVKCISCHTVQEGQNRVGPSLYGIIGRNAGSVEGFNYSDANANSGITWTEEIMFEYLEAPQEYMPGTRMIFPGLPSAQERADIIAYLNSVTE